MTASRGVVSAALFGVMVLSMLPGITRCNVLCKDVDAEGNPITYSCVQCQVTAAEKVECKQDIWFLEPGELCDQAAQQPDLPDGELCDFAGTDDGVCKAGVCEGPLFACTEQGVLDAIAAGGGTINCASPTTINTSAEIVIANDAILDGGGNLTLNGGGTHRVLSVAPGVTAELRRMTIAGGSSVDGGGIWNQGELAILESSITGNTGGGGSGIFTEGSLSVVDSSITGNTNTNGGVGGIYAVTSQLTLKRTTVSDNTGVVGVSEPIAAVQVVFNSQVHVIDSTIDGAGGTTALLSDGFTEVIRSTISNAYIPMVAGGETLVRESFVQYLYTANQAGTNVPATVINSTLEKIDGGLGPTTLVNVTLLGNTPYIRSGVVSNTLFAAGCNPQVPPTFVSGGYNIDPGSYCGLTDPTDQVNVGPAAVPGPLQDNGGPTLTVLPGPGSPAIDAIPVLDCVNSIGLRLNNDQRGVLRPQGTNCDIGAVEVEQP